MANYVFQGPIDLHTGGQDLKYPHHENEMALLEALQNCEQRVNYFVHAGILSAQTRKFGRLIKNTTIKDALSKCSGRQLRLMFLLHRYDTLMEYIPFYQEGNEWLGPIGQAIAIDSKFSEFFFNIQAYLHNNPTNQSQIWLAKDFVINIF